jgi:hypothetical protein
MKTPVGILAILFFLPCCLSAQDATVKGLQADASKEIKSLEKDGWSRSGTFILNINQGALKDWAAGGEQSVLGINTIFNYNTNYRKGKNTWDSYFDIALGFQNATSFSRFRKIDDRIDITSKYGRQLSKTLYAGLLVNFNSQALAGYDYTNTPNTKISNFLTPGKILLSPGFDYKPSKDFSLFFSPATVRFILKNDPDFYSLRKFGVDSAKKSNTEFGAFITAVYNKSINTWATYSGRLDLFSNYIRNPQNIDVYCTNLLTMKFNKWLGSTLSLDLIYDDDVIKKTQIKEIIGLGLAVKL